VVDQVFRDLTPSRRLYRFRKIALSFFQMMAVVELRSFPLHSPPFSTVQDAQSHGQGSCSFAGCVVTEGVALLSVAQRAHSGVHGLSD